MIAFLGRNVRLCPGPHQSVCGLDIEFNSLSEDHQDFAPEDETHNASEIHSFVSSEDMSFQIFIEEVLKLLRADKFLSKTDEVLGGNRL